MKKLLIILVFLSLQVQANSLNQKREHMKINTYLCLGTKKEFNQCVKSGLSECRKKNEERYYKELNCPILLDGLKIAEWNKKYKKTEYEWSKTCVGVKKEYKYCMGQGLLKCGKSMVKRYKYLWCDMVLESEIDK